MATCDGTRFLRLTRADGSELWVNTQYILSVEPLGRGLVSVEFSDGKAGEFRATDPVKDLLGVGGPSNARRQPDSRPSAHSEQRGRDRDDRQRSTGRRQEHSDDTPRQSGGGTYRWMREARFDGQCVRCGGTIYAGEPQLFDTETREVWCKGCVTRPGREAVPLPSEDPDRDMQRAVDHDRDPRDDSGPDPFGDYDDSAPSDREG